MTIAAIVATDLNFAIGKNNKLLCHLPADLKFFKSTTMGCPVIMGRKTFQSIGHPLPGRKNIVISRDTKLSFDGVEVYSSIEECLKKVKEENALAQPEKAFVIGGAEIYSQMLPFTDEIYRTLIQYKFEADTFFPEINFTQFELIWEEPHQKDEKNIYDYVFQKFVRKK